MKFAFYLLASLPLVFSIPVDEATPAPPETNPGQLNLLLNNSTDDISPAAAWCGGYTPQSCRNACRSYNYNCFCCTGNSCSCHNC
ncbi:hypothetical protein BO94DRAFT_539971 [Aspergillus sclerotioniger CBS 115572]|uniref:Invertebrate defensins family profile domain-containing protein n=1 Tax=Aspergillus sclerotioniger CBS 115572 TaxID=1450535 RepID=A0A317V9B1_9EURO|nr:hypothetical protein BO94DRAFT_539971 [Aspergillus sclerotioniger CBS 115572]PWY69628.1 hypothetical protein BO94DRAFT_539971 [Aspergillus sclerotioniger CBS 115572]